MKVVVRYEAAPGAHITDKDAEVIGQTVSAIQRKTRSGLATSKKFVELSRPKSSPTHKHFEWNNAIAGERYRVEQASRLIRAVVVVKTPARKNVRAFHFVRRDPDAGYAAADDVQNERDLFDQVVRRASDELESWLNRYNMLASVPEFRSLFSELQRLHTMRVKAPDAKVLHLVKGA